MGLKLENGDFKGLTADVYYRIKNTGSHNNGSNTQQLVLEKYSSQEYREENEGDAERVVETVTYTDDELEQLETIRYTALKRVDGYTEAEDC